VRQLYREPRSEQPRLPDMGKIKGTAEGRRTYATKTSTRRSQQTLDKPRGPRETGEGVAEAAQDDNTDVTPQDDDMNTGDSEAATMEFDA